MSDREQSPPGPRRRRPVLPPVSSRTLQHPSFMPLWMAADSLHHSHVESQTVDPIIPEEFFYTDPAMDGGRRVPNLMSWLRVFDCSQLNTPPPIMSTRPSPPTRPDPFRSGPFPIRDLGGLTWTIDAVRPRQLVLQLSPDEDQAVTNLLKLHYHQEASPDSPSLQSGSAQGAQGAARFGSWSCSELEAANTLISGFDLNEHRRLHDPPLCQSTKTQQEPDSMTESVSRDCGQTNSRCAASSCVDENRDVWTTEDSSECCPAGFEPKDRLISDTEGDVVHALLSLADCEQ